MCLILRRKNNINILKLQDFGYSLFDSFIFITNSINKM
nr:MAG TPA: hypothetical protein [Caudoviricetes sp.]DAQ56015.1 MAG TPA: hypothetical protein [Caudoviricetes sp.]